MSRKRETDAEFDRRMMQRALKAANRGSPSPNPHVGAVLVKNRRVLAVGHHALCGGPHAEAVALRKAGRRARGATLYVSFEPCDHHGRTPPCTDAILAAGIARVVCGCADPLRPGGARKLRRSGVIVQMGVERDAALRLTADFRKFAIEGLPLVTLKAAVTLDGRLAARTGDSRWITGERARREAHRMRARADAVLVGIGTVLADDPDLTVRHVRGRNPMRVVLDSRLRTPPGSRLVRTASDIPTLIVHAKGAPPARIERLRRAGVETATVPAGARGLRLRSVLRELARRDIVRVLVEGGAAVHGAFLDAGLADRAAVFIAPRILADPKALPLALGKRRLRIADGLGLERVRTRKLGVDLLVEGDVE